MDELIPLQFQKVVQSKAYTVFMLEALEQEFAIYMEPQVGKQLQQIMASKAPTRPLTYELIETLLDGFGISLKQVVLYDVMDTVYFAQLYLEQEINGIKTILNIDARPSDCLLLALKKNAPIFCKKEMLEKLKLAQ